MKKWEGLSDLGLVISSVLHWEHTGLPHEVFLSSTVTSKTYVYLIKPQQFLALGVFCLFYTISHLSFIHSRRFLTMHWVFFTSPSVFAGIK